MPDTITHLALGYIISDLRGYDKAVFLLGSVLPDAKMLSYLLSPWLADQTRYALFYAFDAPLISIPLALIVCSFFRARREVFLCILYAILFHLGLDLLQYKFGGGVALLYPALLERYSLGLFWQDDYAVTVAALLALAGFLLCRRAWLRRAS